MATCYNRNTAAYKALQSKFNDPMMIDSLIFKWQKISKSEEFPTIAQATKYLSQQKTLFNLKTREYSDALLANLSRKKIISKWEGNYYINNTNQRTRLLDRSVLMNNRNKLLRYLDFWNIPRDSVNIVPTSTGKTFNVTVNQGLFSKTDILSRTNNKDNTRILDIIQHMNTMFPKISINTVTVEQAKEFYNSLPEWQKSKVPFSEVNSYYAKGQAVLIKGRVTTETAVEEVLHPFIDTIYQENKGLFKGLLSEARDMFPELTQQINDSYTERRGFSQKVRDLELVTQSLSRHFNREHENEPTQKWYQKLSELLKFFSEIIKDFYKFMTGNKLVVDTSLLRPDASLSGLAKVLNTSDLEFDLNDQSIVDNKVRFSLTPDKKQKVDKYLGLAVNPVQRKTIEQLFHAATESNKNISDFTVSSKLTNSNTPLVILKKDTHTYIDIESGEIYDSTTQKIKGKLDDKEGLYEYNRDLGDDFDAITEALTLGLTKDQFPKMNILNDRQVKNAMGIIGTALSFYRKQGAIIIPQVVVADVGSNIAGSIDLLAVHSDGTLQIIDLKTSKNSVETEAYNKLYPVKEGSVFYNDNKSANDQFKLSTRMQHSIQVNVYGRILSNMGYEVRDTAETFHLLVGVKGRGKNQKFNGSIIVESPITHVESQNLTYVNEIVPINVDSQTKERLEEEAQSAGILSKKGVNLTQEQEKPNGTLDFESYQALDTTIRDFEQKLISIKDAKLLLQSKIKQTNENKRILVQIDIVMGLIADAIHKGTVDVAYEEIVTLAINEIDKFTEYALDPDNFGSPDYIDRVLNFESFAKTFQGLDNVGTGIEDINLNQRQFSLKNKLKSKLNDVIGDSSAKKPGIVSTSIQNYVRKYVKTTSNQDLSNQDVEDILKMADDIGVIELKTGDMDTSRDTISALMGKLFKNQLQKSLDIIDNRNDHIRRLEAKGKALSPRGTIDYSYMHVMVNGKWKGNYVKEIGGQFYELRNERLKELRDETGESLEYIYYDNLEDYDQWELDENKKLYAARTRWSEFNRAEQYIDGMYEDGDYYRYSKEYIEERRKHMIYVTVSDTYGRWEKRTSVSPIVWTKFRNKYHQSKPFTTVKRNSDGEMNGAVNKPAIGHDRVKQEYIEIRPTTSKKVGAKNMRSQKYIDIMNPSPDNALAQWQKEWYMLWVQFFEKDLLEKLPPAIKFDMIGKSPIIMDKTLKHAAQSGSLVTKLWGKTTRGIKDFWTDSMETQNIHTDENGNIVSTLPIFYVGNARTEEALTAIENKIEELTKRYTSPENKLTEKEYNHYKADLEGQRMKLQSQPTLDELSTDMADNLLRFSAMAENYEVMSEIRNTLTAMMKVLEKRTYTPSGVSKVVSNIKGKMMPVTASTEGMYRSNIVERAQKWMNMVYYDNEQRERDLMDKISAQLISTSSLTYVGFNLWGNINNYAVGRINNTIEAIGGRYFDPKAYIRAEKEFNLKALPGFFTSIGKKEGGIPIPGSKYEALVNHYRMMDAKSDIRESSKSVGKETAWDNVKSFGYLAQDGAEYNVQTKIGMAILMSKKIRNASGDEMSLFDAYQFNNRTGELKLKEGYDQIISDKNGALTGEDIMISDFSDNSRYDIRNYIREVNKQTHGNYAHVDRMVIQNHWLGQLGAQFHKWVAPGIKARYRGEYFDENLGWMEGRHRSAMKFMLFFFKNLSDIGNISENFKEKYEKESKGKGIDKLASVWRTAAEIGLMFSSFFMAALLESMFDDDDDEKSVHTQRLENALIYQMNRQARELLFFIPGFGVREVFMMSKSPIAVTRLLGEMGEAAYQAMWLPIGWSTNKLMDENYDVKKDKDYYYQRGNKKGQAKIGKEFGDIIPGWYMLNRYRMYDTQKDFKVK